MELMRLKLGIEKERFMNIIADHGNVVAASIPMALNDAIMQNRVKRGDRVMLVGTSAGLSLGGLILVY
ncbi:MAG TPA: beta-ketoacyl-ACP synthase III, partial [Paenibacillaceae bacterium]|nr:beta-ketoacyl-ACP synthase III [Paenibacillaceae bacterium]